MIYLGETEDGESFELSTVSSQVALHCLGVQGSGKSTTLGQIAVAANNQGEGVIVPDFKDGKLAEDVAMQADPARLLYFEPGAIRKAGRTMGLNPLVGDPSVVTNTTLDIFNRTGAADLSFMTRVKKFSRAGIELCAHQPHQTTLQDVRDVIAKRDKRRAFMAKAIDLPQSVRDAWDEFDLLETQRGDTSAKQREQTESTLSRFDDFLIPRTTGAILSQPQNTIDLAAELDAGKLIVFNLVEGVSHQRESLFLADVVMALIVNAAMQRRVTKHSRVWRVVADEFDLLAPDSIILAIDKLRAAKIFFVMANQNMEQIKDERLEASLTSAPVKIYFRISPKDIPGMGKVVGSPQRARELAKLPRYHAYVQVPREDEEPSVWSFLGDDDDDEWKKVALANWDREPDHEQLEAARQRQLQEPYSVLLAQAKTDLPVIPMRSEDRVDDRADQDEAQPTVPSTATARPDAGSDRAGGKDSLRDRLKSLRFKRPD